MRLRKFRYNYFDVSIPSDIGGDIDSLANLVINCAREQAKDFAIPASWQVKKLGESGGEDLYRVCRKSYRKSK